SATARLTSCCSRASCCAIRTGRCTRPITSDTRCRGRRSTSARRTGTRRRDSCCPTTKARRTKRFGTRYHRTVRALLVEDDGTIAEFVVRGLREAGFAVDRVSDGEAGLTIASQDPYDVAIVDVMLPKRDGLSLIQAL